MRQNNRFWIAFALAAVVCGAALQGTGIILKGWPPSRPPLPIPGREFVSATRDGLTEHSLFYFNLFGFGDRIRNADVLVVGSSHAEFGINASAFAREHSLNMALGGGEGLSFAAMILAKYRPRPDLVVVDTFAPDDGLSTEAVKTLASTPAVSLRAVLNIWSGFLRDWMLQGLLPRITIGQSPLWEQPIGATVIRDWRTADVTAVYSNAGELFSDPSKSRPMDTGPLWKGYAPTAEALSVIKQASTSIIVTAIPYPSFTDQIARETAIKLAGAFVPVPADGMRFWDYHHLHKSGRELATSILMNSPMARRAGGASHFQ